MSDTSTSCYVNSEKEIIFKDLVSKSVKYVVDRCDWVTISRPSGEQYLLTSEELFPFPCEILVI